MTDQRLITEFDNYTAEWKATGVQPAGAEAATANVIAIVERNRPLRPEALRALTHVDWAPALAYLRELTPSGMIFVPAGSFTMGSTEREDEQPVHTVWLDSYYIDRTPVTNRQFAFFWEDVSYSEPSEAWHGFETAREMIRMTQMRRAPYHWFDDTFNAPRKPVVGVSWYEAAVFGRWAGKRLPSEAEWERAARGTDARRYPWGNDWDAARCNTNMADGALTLTTPVGAFSPQGDSPCGAQDMAGNVWEWTSSLYQSYPFNSDDGRENPTTEGTRVLRGGGYRSTFEDHYRTAYRYHQPPAYFYFAVGFRCAASIPPDMRL